MFRKIIFALTVLYSFASHAEETSLYETELKIEATGENASQAREKALADANRKAVYAIMDRISPQGSTKILDDLNDNQILNFIQQVSVNSEKVTDSRYLADLNITINAPILKAYLAEKDIPITILPESTVFVIPVYRSSETAVPTLWEEDNPWYQSWEENSLSNGQLTIKPLPNNRSNKKAITADEALQLNGISLDSIRRSNDNADIYVAEILIDGENIDLTLKSPLYGTILSKTYEGNLSLVFSKAIQDTKSAVINKIQQQSQLQQSGQSNITIVYNFNNLKEWMEVRKKISDFPTVKKMNIDAMSGRRAQITISFGGDLEAILTTFENNGLRLTSSGNYYTLERM